MIRPDYLFSYWILTWYICYMLGFFSHNPKFAIMLGLFSNLLLWFAMIYYRLPLKHILFFLILIVLYSVIPLWTVRNTKITQMDIQATIGLGVMYLGWMLWEEELEVLYKTSIGMLNVHHETPGMYVLNQLFKMT